MRTAWASALVVLICWAQPVVEQFTSDGPGNMTLIADGIRESDAEAIGPGLGIRTVASVLTLRWIVRRDETAAPMGVARSRPFSHRRSARSWRECQYVAQP